MLEVISPKFPSVEQHVEFLSALLDDLFARAARLPFAVSADTARGVVDVPAPPTPLFTLHFLLQHARALREAAGVVVARPHRRLADRPEFVPLAAVSEADPDVLLDVLTSPERWVRASGFPLATKLRGHAPSEVWQRRPEETLDTPENRFVKAFLRDLLFAAESLPRQPWWRQVSADRQRVIHETESMLRLTLAQPMFTEVGDLRRIPSSSRVLLRREGYRELLDAWRLFNLARRPFFGHLQRAIDLRDIATLYEVWCFFALVEEIQPPRWTSRRCCRCTSPTSMASTGARKRASARQARSSTTVLYAATRSASAPTTSGTATANPKSPSTPNSASTAPTGPTRHQPRPSRTTTYTRCIRIGMRWGCGRRWWCIRGMSQRCFRGRKLDCHGILV